MQAWLKPCRNLINWQDPSIGQTSKTFLLVNHWRCKIPAGKLQKKSKAAKSLCHENVSQLTFHWLNSGMCQSGLFTCSNSLFTAESQHLLPSPIRGCQQTELPWELLFSITASWGFSYPIFSMGTHCSPATPFSPKDVCNSRAQSWALHSLYIHVYL